MLNGHIYSIHLGIFFLENRNKILKNISYRALQDSFLKQADKISFNTSILLCVCVCAEFFFFNFKKCLSLASSQNVKHRITL